VKKTTTSRPRAPLDHTIPSLGYRFQEKDLPGKFDGSKADAMGVPFGPERGLLQRGESITLRDGRVVHPEELVGPPRQGKSVAYITDTGFCIAARRLATDVDLIIHEATYGDDQLDMALDRKHSTIRHAATIARGAGAKKFIATHFSTRYEGAALAQLETEGREVFPDHHHGARSPADRSLIRPPSRVTNPSGGRDRAES
jgi:ribonuclease Z